MEAVFIKMEKFRLESLDEENIKYIDKQLSEYDAEHIGYSIEGNVSIGFFDEEELIAGVDACMSVYKILYVSTLFVKESYRNRGIGTKLMNLLEIRAKKLGANIIRLDSFSWQGGDFYEKIGFVKVGEYSSEEDGFYESFFIKRI